MMEGRCILERFALPNGRAVANLEISSHVGRKSVHHPVNFPNFEDSGWEDGVCDSLHIHHINAVFFESFEEKRR